MLRFGTVFASGSLVSVTSTIVLIWGSSCWARDWGQISRDAQDSVVYIEVTRFNRDGTDREVSTGTGFLVRGTGAGGKATGYGVTVAHAVPEGTGDQVVELKASVGSRAGVPQNVIVISRDLELDIALFRLEAPPSGAKGLIIDTNPSADRGSELAALGFSLGSGLRFVSGTLSNPIGSHGRWVTNLNLNKGDSGGPVFASNGDVIGVVVGAQSDANSYTYVIPANLLYNILTLIPSVGHAQTPSQPSQTAYRVVGVAFGDTLRVRTEPNANAREAGRLPPGVRELTKFECYPNGWCRIGQNGRELGYVNARYLEPDAPGRDETVEPQEPSSPSSSPSPPSCTALRDESQGIFSVIGVRRDDTLKMRSEPKVRPNNVLADIPATATEVTVGACSNGWCLIGYEGKCGYAASQFLANEDTRRAPAQSR